MSANNMVDVSTKWGSYKILDTHTKKMVLSPEYNFCFDKVTGFMMRWGKTLATKDDALYSPFGPELLDIEISVNGCPPVGGKNCEFCYKGNTSAPASNMSLETFKKILDCMPPTLTQIAFGITGTQTNPDFLSMMRLCRDKMIVPNFTLSGADLTEEFAQEAASLVGALSVSVYAADKSICYDTVKTFTDLGLKQTNIHLVLMSENMDFAREVVDDCAHDSRLRDMGALVFLSAKPKGRARGKFSCVTSDQFSELCSRCMDLKVNMGFDSCSSHKFESFVDSRDSSSFSKLLMKMMGDPCESFGVFSCYVNVDGKYFPCSFSEGEGDWSEGLSFIDEPDFLDSVWYHEKTCEWRHKSLDCGRKCLVFPEIS